MKTVAISPRLMRIASFVPRGAVVADIGTDHGFLPIRLVQEGIIDTAYACDVREGPLERAREHILENGLAGRIFPRLGDGLRCLSPGEADTAVIAGMGGPLMVRILEDSPAVAEALERLILSPQSEIDTVRRYLAGAGWKVVREEMLLDAGKYYTVMEAVRGEEAPLSECEALFGRYLMDHGDPVLREFLDREETSCGELLAHLANSPTEKAALRAAEIRNLQSLIGQAKQRMAAAIKPEEQEDAMQ